MADPDHPADCQLRREGGEPLEVRQARRADSKHRRTGAAESGDRGFGVQSVIRRNRRGDVLRHLIDVGEQAAE